MRTAFVLWGLGVVGFAQGCAGQDWTPAAPSSKDPAPPSSPAPPAAGDPAKTGAITLTGSLRARFYDWDWFQAAAGQNQYEHSGNFLRFSVAGKLRTWDWNAEFAAPFLLALPANATVAAPQGALGFGSNYYTSNHNAQNTAMIFPRQLYLRLTGFGKGASLQIGRFSFPEGAAPKNTTLAALRNGRIAQRLIGDFGFTDIGRSFDGVHFDYTRPSQEFTFVAAAPTRGVFQVDGWGWNRVAFGYAAYTKDWGRGRHAAETGLFVIDYDDWRHILKTDNRPLGVRRGDTGNIQIQTFGGYSIHSFTTRAGAPDAVVWGAVQTGRWGTEPQHAFAIDLEAGFQPKILPKIRPWIRGGYTFGSGDGNPNDHRHQTFFQILPTPRPYARFPFFNMMNTADAYGILILRPHPKLTLSSEFHSLRLADANDLWYSGGGVYQPWTFGYVGRATAGRRSLANLYDLNAEYRMNRAVTLTAYFGYAQGLASMEQIYPQGKDAELGYVEVLYRF